MADPESDGEDHRRFETGRYGEHFEIVELSEAAERFLAEHEGIALESESTDDEDEEDGDIDYTPVENTPDREEIGNNVSTFAQARSGEEGGDNKRRRQGEGEAVASYSEGVSSQGNEWNEIDGLFCPICMESWTNDGDHHIWYVNPSGVFLVLVLDYQFSPPQNSVIAVSFKLV